MGRHKLNNVTDSKEQEAVMVRYLLGQLPEDERARVEERYFSNGEYFDQLLALEDSLIDDFVTGRMPAEQLSAFNESLSARQDDIRFSRALFHAVTKKNLGQAKSEPERRLPVKNRSAFAPGRSFRWAVSIAALVLLALALALFLRNQTLQDRLSRTEAQLDALKKEKEAAEQELNQARSQAEQELEIERNKRIDAENLLQQQGRPESPRGSPDSMTIPLVATLSSRGTTGAAKDVRIPENVRWLRFVMPVKRTGEYESYRVSIKLAGERVVFESGSLKPTGASRGLAVTVPAANLAPGDYILTLNGENPGAAPTELGRYSVRIAR